MAQSSDEVSRDPRGTVHTSASTEPSPAPTTDELRSRIEETRAELSDTIDAIQDRLSPSRLMTQAKATVKEATVGRVKNLAHRATTQVGNIGAQSSSTLGNVLDRVRDNPVPAALGSVAAAGVLLRAIRRRQTGTVGANARFLAAAGAGIACWVLWKARASTR